MFKKSRGRGGFASGALSRPKTCTELAIEEARQRKKVLTDELRRTSDTKAAERELKNRAYLEKLNKENAALAARLARLTVSSTSPSTSQPAPGPSTKPKAAPKPVKPERKVITNADGTTTIDKGYTPEQIAKARERNAKKREARARKQAASGTSASPVGVSEAVLNPTGPSDWAETMANANALNTADNLKS